MNEKKIKELTVWLREVKKAIDVRIKAKQACKDAYEYYFEATAASFMEEKDTDLKILHDKLENEIKNILYASHTNSVV